MSDPVAKDEELMTSLCEGDKNALEELVKRYQNDVFRFTLHYVRDYEVAKELTQEAFIRVYVARERFDTERRFRPWLLCIARNLSLNEIKRKKAIPMETLDQYASAAREESGELHEHGVDGPDQLLMDRERREMLARALASLDQESREIVVMRFFERLQAREIAEVIGSTEGAVRTRLHRILRGLRARYESIKDTI